MISKSSFSQTHPNKALMQSAPAKAAHRVAHGMARTMPTDTPFALSEFAEILPSQHGKPTSASF